MRLPWVSRGRFEDALKRIEELKSEIVELKGDRRKYADFLAKHSVGDTIFEAMPAAPAKPSSTDVPEAPEDEFSTAVSRARKAGYTSPRAIADYITKENEKRFDEKRRNDLFSTPRAIVTDSVPVNADFEAAIREGEEAATAR